MPVTHSSTLDTGHWTRSNPVYKMSTFTALGSSNVLITG